MVFQKMSTLQPCSVLVEHLDRTAASLLSPKLRSLENISAGSLSLVVPLSRLAWNAIQHADGQHLELLDSSFYSWVAPKRRNSLELKIPIQKKLLNQEVSG